MYEYKSNILKESFSFSGNLAVLHLNGSQWRRVIPAAADACAEWGDFTNCGIKCTKCLEAECVG